MVDWDYARIVSERISQRKARCNENLEAEVKSLRKYSSEVHPLLRERLDVHFGTHVGPGLVFRTNTFDCIKGNNDNFRASAVMNWLFQSFYDQEEPRIGEVIEIRVSSKTFNNDKITIEEETMTEFVNIANKIRRVPNLDDFISNELGFEVALDLLQSDFTQSTLSRSIQDFLVDNNYMFPAGKCVSVPGRVIKTDLIMNVKYYPGRDDNRAYCMDKNKLRSLCGAILHRLIQPKNMRLRKRLHSSSIVPSIGKDKLDIIIRKNAGNVHAVIIADISNFTGSAANAWLTLYCMALELSLGRIPEKEDNLFCVGGVHFTASWGSVIRAYLYLTVGYPCTSSSSGSQHVLPGGFLGVNGNITVAMLFYSMFLSWLNRNKPGYVKHVKTQAGGDDVTIILELERHDAARGANWVKSQLERFVGFVKELTYSIFEDQDVGIIEGLLYCRSRVRKVMQGGCFRLQTEDSIPLSEKLTAQYPLRNSDAQQEAWYKLDLELLRHTNQNRGHVEIADALRTMFVDAHHHVKPLRALIKYIDCTEEVIITDDGRHVTPKALELSNSVDLYFVNSNVYYRTEAQRIQYKLRRGELEMIKVQYQGALVMLVATTGESTSIRRRCRIRSYHKVGIVRNQALRLLFTK
jgi:hypothetical protein